MVDERQALGERLRTLRSDAGLTQSALARAAGCARNAVSRLERGETAKVPEVDLVDKIVDLCLEAMGADAAVRRERKRLVRDAHQRLIDSQEDRAGINNLPLGISGFVGRRGELAELGEAARGRRQARLYSINGMPGVGKSELAVHAARRAGRQLRDFQLIVDLRGHTPGRDPLTATEALEVLLTLVRVQRVPSSLEARSGRWRSITAGTRGVLILDNARDSSQVVPLLPGSPEWLVLVTSRHRLNGVEGVDLEVSPPSASEASEMLARSAGRSIASDDPAARQLVELVGRLPLAISLLAGRLRTRRALPLGELLEDLTASASRLAHLKDPHRGVAAAFSVSYRAQPREHQVFLRMLGLHPGPSIDAFAASAITLLALDEAAARLVGLHDGHLLSAHGSRRFVMHDLIAEFVRDLGPTMGERQSTDTLVRLLLYFETASRDADAQLGPAPASAEESYSGPRPVFASRRDALEWLEVERPNLRAAVDHPGTPARRLIGLVDALSRHLRLAGPWSTAKHFHRRALEGADRLSEGAARSRHLLGLGTAAKNEGNYDEATKILSEATQAGGERTAGFAALELGGVHYLLGAYEDARRTFSKLLEDPNGEIRARAQLELGTLAYVEDDYDAAETLLNAAYESFVELGDPHGQASCLKNLGNTAYFADRYPEAERRLRSAGDLFRELGDRLGQLQTETKLGSVYRLLGQYDDAVERLASAAQESRLLEDKSLEAETLIDLGSAYAALGEIDQAETTFVRSLYLYDVIGESMGHVCAHKEYADMCRGLGRLADAELHLGSANDLLGERPDVLLFASVRSSMGALSLAQGERSEAKERFTEALAAAREIPSPLEIGIALTGLGHVARAEGDRQGASRYLTNALEHFDRIGAAEVASIRTELSDIERVGPT